MFKEVLNLLTKQLYPTGRAFRVSKDGELDKMHDGLILSENRFHEDIRAVLNSILPDNDDFTLQDATRWEQLLGLITNENVSLDERKQAIIRKMNHPGIVRARQNYLYLQEQLQLAGFTVYVHELIPDTLISVLVSYMEMVQCGQYQVGQIQCGQLYYANKVVNHLDDLKDRFFAVGNNNRSIFVVGRSGFGGFTSVPTARKEEFRQLILKIKPAQSVGYLLINYT